MSADLFAVLRAIGQEHNALLRRQQRRLTRAMSRSIKNSQYRHSEQKQACSRRRDQIAGGRLTVANGLAIAVP